MLGNGGATTGKCLLRSSGLLGAHGSAPWDPVVGRWPWGSALPPSRRKEMDRAGIVMGRQPSVHKGSVEEGRIWAVGLRAACVGHRDDITHRRRHLSVVSGQHVAADASATRPTPRRRRRPDDLGHPRRRQRAQRAGTPIRTNLSPPSSTGGTFGQLFDTSVNGAVYGQPLVDDGQLLVNTENNYSYGLDPVSGEILWTPAVRLATAGQRHRLRRPGPDHGHHRHTGGGPGHGDRVRHGRRVRLG